MNIVEKTTSDSHSLFVPIQKMSTETNLRQKYEKSMNILSSIQYNILQGITGEQITPTHLHLFNHEIKKYLETNKEIMEQYKRIFKIPIEMGFEMKNIELLGNKKIKEITEIYMKEILSETGNQRIQSIKVNVPEYEERIEKFQEFLFQLQYDALKVFNLQTPLGWLRFMSSFQIFLFTYEDKEFVKNILEKQQEIAKSLE
jgi:hypothetical protein